MSAIISLVVPVRNAGDALLKQIAGLDRQTLGAAAWEIVYVDGGSTDSTSARLTSLERYRPNVVVRSLSDDLSWWGLTRAGLEAASGAWILPCDVRDQFTRAGLQRLVQATAGQDGETAAVVARSVDHARTGVDDRLFLGPEVQPGQELAALVAPAVLYRRESLSSSDGLTSAYPAAQLAARLTRSHPHIALLPGYPVMIGSGLRGRVGDVDRVEDVVAAMSEAASPDAAAVPLAWALGRAGARLSQLERLPEVVGRAQDVAESLPAGPERVLLGLVGRGSARLASAVATLMRMPSLTVVHSEVTWEGECVAVRVEAELSLDADMPEGLTEDEVTQLLAAAAPRLGLRNRLTTSIYPVNDLQQRCVRVEGSRAAIVAQALIDPRTLNDGQVLPRAAYQVVLEVLGVGWGAVPQTTLRGDVDLPAVLGEALVSVRDVPKAGLHIDVNAVRRSLLGRLPAEQCSVVEDARGALLTMPVPDLVVADADGPVSGQVLLGGLPFRSRLVLDGAARVECWASGLPGRVEIKTRFGPGPASGSGCELVTRPDGTFVVQPFSGSSPSSSAIAPTVATGQSYKGSRRTPQERSGPENTTTGPTEQEAAPPQPARRRGGSVGRRLRNVPLLRRGARAVRQALSVARRRTPGR